MPISISGSSGISGVAGTAGSPSISGADTNSGINFENGGVNISIGSSNRLNIDQNGNIIVSGIITASSFSGDIDGTATTAGYATTAGISTISGYAATSGISTISGYATTAGISTISGYATTAGISTTATVAEGLTGTPNINVGIATVTGLGGVAYVAISTVGEDTNKLLVNREYVTAIGVGTTAGITITLPTSPSPGWEVGVAIAGTFSDTVIDRNGSNIMSLAENLTLDTAYISVQLVYVNSTVGWRFF